MKRSALKDQTLPELLAKSRDLRQELFNLRLQQAGSQLEKSSRLRTIRRDIARVETRISSLRRPAPAKAANPSPATTAAEPATQAAS